jgi:hypothetical protein
MVDNGMWDPSTPGVMRLPSGRLVRGRGLRRARRADGVARTAAEPEFGLYVVGRRPPQTPWPMRWLPWPDFGLPGDREAAAEAIRDVWERTSCQRVEVACGGGHGRTGTVLACLAVLDGVPGGEAVAYVRAHYDRKAVETPWQRRFVEGFPGRRGRG